MSTLTSIHVSLTKADDLVLTKLSDEIKLRKSALFRRAFKIYVLLYKHIKNGSVLCVKKTDGSITELLIDGLGE